MAAIVCVIDRAEWNTGERLGPSRLYDRNDDQDHLCCLGFLGRACGIDDADLMDVGMPSEVASGYPTELFRVPLVHVDGARAMPSNWEDVFARVNDAPADVVDDETREAWIREGFWRVLGVRVEFVGEYPKVYSGVPE